MNISKALILLSLVLVMASCHEKEPAYKAKLNIKPEPVKISRDELYELHLSRAQHILNVAAGQGVDILILGAFGCGAFMNDPNTVARAYSDALKEYAQYFDVAVSDFL